MRSDRTNRHLHLFRRGLLVLALCSIASAPRIARAEACPNAPAIAAEARVLENAARQLSWALRVSPEVGGAEYLARPLRAGARRLARAADRGADCQSLRSMLGVVWTSFNALENYVWHMPMRPPSGYLWSSMSFVRQIIGYLGAILR
jgi:hypothetical protein